MRIGTTPSRHAHTSKLMKVKSYIRLMTTVAGGGGGTTFGTVAEVVDGWASGNRTAWGQLQAIQEDTQLVLELKRRNTCKKS